MSERVNEDVAQLRGALKRAGAWFSVPALDRLEARLEAAEAERDEAKHQRSVATEWAAELAGAKHRFDADLAAARAERDEWKQSLLRSASRNIEEARADAERLAGLLARVEPELAPNHDEAEQLRTKFGLGGGVPLIADIRTALAAHDNAEEEGA